MSESSSIGISPRGAQLAGVNIAALILATVVTALRCFVRIRLLKAFGIDDWLMLAATITFILYCTFSITGVTHGTGHRVDDLTKEAESEAKRWWYLCYPAYSVTMLLVKMSVACFFYRIIVRRVHKWVLFIASALTFVSCSAFFFACIFQCWPVSYFWDKHTQTGTCIPNRIIIALAILFSAINLITDFTFALMPAWILSHLKMRTKTKVALVILMGLGCVASAAVVVRLPYLHLIASDDFLYDSFHVAVWSTVEQGLAITAGGLATLQPLLKLIAYKLGLRSQPSLPNYGSGYGSNMRMTTGISVKRSFTRRTETFTTPHVPFDQTATKFPPGPGAYSAACYNTSQEMLRDPTSASDGKSSKDSDVGTIARVETKGTTAVQVRE